VLQYAPRNEESIMAEPRQSRSQEAAGAETPRHVDPVLHLISLAEAALPGLSAPDAEAMGKAIADAREWRAALSKNAARLVDQAGDAAVADAWRKLAGPADSTNLGENHH
jgi:hypothetical protein